MPWIHTFVREVASILQTGAMRLVNWLVGSGRSRNSAIGELQQRYPDAPVENVTTVYESMVQASQVGQELTGTGIHPPLPTVPIDPTIPPPAAVRYDLNVTIRGYQGGQTTGRPANLRTIFAPYEAVGEQNMDQLKKWALERAQELVRQDTLPGIDSVEVRITSVSVEVVSITRVE